MCGICGMVSADSSRVFERAALEKMNRSMTHRGPDDEGYHLEPGVALGMRRLSIVDLAHGKQPFEYDQTVVIQNGEIYNYHGLRNALQKRGHTFKTNSDTEVLSPAYLEFGSLFLQELAGMFAIALWDKRTKRLLLARDRMGKKPLYWTLQKGVLSFGSELKVLLASPFVEAKLDHLSLQKYLAHEYIPAPRSIFENIFKLEPGHVLIFENGKVETKRYWDVALEGESTHMSEQFATQEFKALFERAVERRLMSDVPLGVFLSGGLDSSSVVAAMRKYMEPKQIKTFSIGFAEKSFDESSYARQVAQHFGTDHREQICTPEQLMDLLPEVVNFLDEPLGDASLIPTFALSKFTRQHVTVALGGDGGDELFAGYPTFLAERYAQQYLRCPALLRNKLIEPLIRALPVSDENISFDFKAKQFIKGADRDVVSRHMTWMGSFSAEEQKDLLLQQSAGDVLSEARAYYKRAQHASAGNQLLYLYKKMYLADDILTKVDRASMAASLECRAPFLDHDVVNFVARLPYQFKLHGSTLKYLLKKSYEKELPQGIAARSKKGFGIPVAKWLKGPLKDLAQQQFSEKRLREQGIFQSAEVHRLLSEHLSGKADHRKKLWTLLIFQLWWEKWGK